MIWNRKRTTSIVITNSGDLIKISVGNKVQYYEPGDFIKNFIIDTVSLSVTFIHNNYTLFSSTLSGITINGVSPATITDLEIALRSLIALSKKIDSLIALGFMSAAITAPVRRVSALGNNPDVDQGSVPETIWPGGGLYPWMTGATSLEAVSTSAQDAAGGTGMAAISLVLMNTSYFESNVAVALNGTTPVAISGTWFRINGGITTTKGSGAAINNVSNAGDIIIRDAGGGTVRGIIQAGKGIMRQALFTVPTGYSLQVVSQYIGFNRGTGIGGTRYLTVTGFIQNSSGVARRPLDLSCNGESYRHDGIPGIMLPEKTDFALEALSVSADNSDVTGAFLGVLMRNDIISNLSIP